MNSARLCGYRLKERILILRVSNLYKKVSLLSAIKTEVWDFCLSVCTLRAESPSIFLEKLGRGRRLCSRPAHSLIRRSSKKMDESVQFRTGHTGLPLVCMLNRKNCWLFRAHGILFTIDRQTWQLLRFHTKSLKKPWNVLSQNLNWIGPISSLTEPQSRSLFNFLCQISRFDD